MLSWHKNNAKFIFQIFKGFNGIFKSVIFHDYVILFNWMILQIVYFTILLEHFSMLFGFTDSNYFQKFRLAFCVRIKTHHIFFIWNDNGIFILGLIWKSLVVQQLLKQIFWFFISVMILENFFFHAVMLILENWLLMIMIMIIILSDCFWAPYVFTILFSWNHGIRIRHAFRRKSLKAIIYFAHVLVKLFSTFCPGFLTLLFSRVLIGFCSG